MADLSEDELHAMERAHRADETERCALLCEKLAGVHMIGAAKLRRDGSYTVRCIWPFGKKETLVRPGFERQAQIRDAAVHTLGVMAMCIRRGFDPRKLKEDPNEQADLDKVKGMTC